MSTNLLTNFINNSATRPTVPQQPKAADVEIVNVVRHKPNFDINRELANRTFIKPLPSKAKLVKNGIFDAPAIFVKDTIYDLNALKAGIKGDANDHQLGKLNDLGLKIGGLAIAAYLFTKRQQPTSKVMEFVGLGTFLASMALWPKFALQLPAYLIHGVDVMPQYEDSFGRKKPLYQDNLFIPWDVYSDEQINKYGDRLGVPKDMPNRREFIQEKMRKLALQNNTMWMLTAGVATPVMSALLCNALTDPVTKMVDKYSSKQADKMLLKFPEAVKKAKDTKIEDAVEALVEIHKEKTIDKDMIKSFAVALGGERDAHVMRAIEQDLTNLLLKDNRTYTIPKDIVPKIVKAAHGVLDSKFDKSILDVVLPDEQQLLERFEKSKALCTHDFQKNIFGSELSSDELIKVFSDFDDMIRENIKKYNTLHPEKPLRKDVESAIILKRLQGKTFTDSPVFKILSSAPSTKFDESAQYIVKYLAETMTDFSAKNKVLDKYAFTKFGSTSNLANYWNEVDSNIVKALNFTDKELALMKDDRMLVTPMLREKLETIAADETQYKKVVGAICEKMAKLGETIKGNSVGETYINAVDEVFEQAADKLRLVSVSLPNGQKVQVEMPALVKQLVGFDELLNKQKANRKAAISAFSQKDIQKSFAEGRILSVQSSFQRVLNTLDLYRRVATLKNIGSTGDKKTSVEILEEKINAAKELQLDAHMADYETKFFTLRNPNPAKGAENIHLKVENGKQVLQFLDKNGFKRVDIPADPAFFTDLIKLMYMEDMHPDTVELLIKHNIQGMADYREAMAKEVGDADYFAKMFHRVFSKYGEGVKSSSERKFFLIGKSFTDLIHDAANTKFNTTKWLKMFGSIGAGLLGVTVLAQFFFGKLSLPKEAKKG